MEYTKFFINEMISKRKELKITQKKLAELSGIKRSSIAMIEHTKRGVTLDNAFRISRALDLDLVLGSVVCDF